MDQDDLHASYVERSLKELQRAVDEKEKELAELRRAVAAAPPLQSSVAQEASLAILAAAYEDASKADDPFLPFGDSVLPALVALRKTHETVAQSQTYLADEGRPKLDRARRQLALEQARLVDQQALQQALEARSSTLQNRRDETARRPTAEQLRAEKREALRAEKQRYDRDTAALMKQLRGFLQSPLGPMLAAEELGGPVVGSMVDVQAEDLAAGFSAQGKPKRRSTKTATQSDKRQRRIDEIWGAKDERNGNDNNDDENWDEATAAAAEMQDLTEQLLNALSSARGDGSAAYVALSRESAAARFLVRSKVAQFHPRDAMRLRLVDFGRDLDD